MQSRKENLPPVLRSRATAEGGRVSFIMPTLNAGALLDNCLASIARQTYPRDRCEIILADAHSTDSTRDIARKYGAMVLDDDGKNMEEGKRLALQHASGEFIVFVDADNEITHADYIELAVKALAANPQALGVESYYLPSSKMSAFCAYLTHLLHISDPMAWLMSAKPTLVARDGEVERWTLPGGSLSYPLGANGFVFRRADLESVRANEHFQDTHVALFLMKNGKREWLRIRGRGVYHYYIQTLWRFVQKRRRATVHFLRVQEEMPVNWMKEKPPVPLWLAVVYCVTFIGPLWHALRGVVRDRDARWLWHLPACLGSVLGNAWGVLTYKRRGSDKKLIAELQVKQNLKTLNRAEEAMSPSPAPFAADPGSSRRPRVVFFVNGIFSEQIGGGDIFFAYIARAALAAGYPLHFFGGHALKRYLEREGLPLNLTLTDHGMAQLGDTGRMSGQLRLLWDFRRRFVRTMRLLSEVQPEDIAYGVSEYWFDTIPVMRCRARHKAFHLGMMAPRLREVLFKSRADVTTLRLPALYFWLSQQFSCRLFRLCRGGVITYPHPEIREYLMRFGHRESALWYIPNGSDVALADRVPPQEKRFDVAWMGRVHPQKGIDDLLETLGWLKQQVPDFRAVIIGKSQEKLEPIIRQMGLTDSVTFSGLVSEEEKFRLLKSTRVFVMPSRYESWGIVVGEAIASGVPVVAYDLACYRPVFGDFVRYVKCFDRGSFKRAVEDEVRQQRTGRNYLAGLDPSALKRTIDWSATQESFLSLLQRMRGVGTSAH